MKIFVGPDWKCHATNPDGIFREVETDFFAGKCPAFIEGHYFVPTGEERTGNDGTKYHGEQITPWRALDELEAEQREYERQLLAEYEAALANSIPVSDLNAAYWEGVNSI